MLTNWKKRRNYMFTADERVNLIRSVVKDYKNVSVEKYNGLLANFAKEKKAVAIIKGLRAVTDFEDEFQQALTNKKLNTELETVFLTTGAENMYLSSSVVKEVCELGGDISGFVPAEIEQKIKERIIKNKIER